jgi:hypothetical protein
MSQIAPRALVVAAEGQLSTSLAGEIVILSLADSTYYGLERVGVRVWELLQVPCRVDAIVDRVVSDYDVSRERAEADIVALLDDLHRRGLITVLP